MFPDLKQKYLGIIANDAAQAAANATKRMFEGSLAQKRAELPSQTPPRADALPFQASSTPSPDTVVANPLLAPYLPPAPVVKPQVEEEKLRSMAKWKATVNLKYVETISRFARDVLGGMAASDLMVEMVERLESNDAALSEHDREMAQGMQKAVERRRKIEKAKSAILSDLEVIAIYEEIIFQQMREQNLRGELQLQSPNEFFWSLTLITVAEIGSAGKEVIAEKMSGAVAKFKPKPKHP
ncbi:hypothetical protein [Runella zeae]|uniref:hypothetical protein n=1 Tax=Runella zeae TaxID=94255 RepID=UPI0004261FC0|nr:hypothetical protein [Runella zeae]